MYYGRSLHALPRIRCTRTFKAGSYPGMKYRLFGIIGTKPFQLYFLTTGEKQGEGEYYVKNEDGTYLVWSVNARIELYTAEIPQDAILIYTSKEDKL